MLCVCMYVCVRALLFPQTALATALDVVAKHGQFRQRLAIKSPILLSLMQLPPYTKVRIWGEGQCTPVQHQASPRMPEV